MGKTVTRSAALDADLVASWRERLDDLVRNVKSWSRQRKWSVTEEETLIREENLPPYAAPLLHIALPQGEVHLEPIAMNVAGWEGCVDLMAWPSLNRVRLVSKNSQWFILTESNIQYPKPWSRSTFVELVEALASAP